MTPGTYLRLRREAAGLSIDDVAVLISAHERHRSFNAGAIGMIERDLWPVPPDYADRLRCAFAFDRFVLRQLVCHLEPVPEICATCGCSALDACDDELAGPCGWASPANDLCTRCAGEAARAFPEEKSHA